MRPLALPGGGDACRLACASFTETVEKENMAPFLSRGVLLGLSGGADSVLLFRLLLAASRAWDFPFACVHVHHGIRGAEADRDAAFCRALCARENVPFFCVTEDVPAYCKAHGMGIEEGARRVRYAAFDRILAENPVYGVIATAHTATDNLETLLFRMLRGSGLHGLCGIAPVRGNVIRPLLALARRDILAALAELDEPYRTDTTNACTDYDRNYIRAEILPRFERLRPDPEAAAARLLANLREEDEAAARAADDAYGRYVRDGGILCADLAALSRATGARLLFRLFRESGGETVPERVHLDAIFTQIARAARYADCPMPDGLSARIDGGRLTFTRTENEEFPAYEIALAEGENRLPGGACLFLRAARDPAWEARQEKIYNLFIQALISFATMEKPLTARTRRPGDAYRAGNMTRVLRRMMTDAKLPHATRAILPVVCDENGPLWLPGFAVRDDARPGKDARAAYLYFGYGEKEKTI